jgi:hydroxyethylthiazole kinase-like uncharacterized protein yjeF
MRLLRTAAIRAIEAPALAAGVPLMQRAGLAAARVAQDMLAAAGHSPARVLILCGPGNNGGDGYEAGAHLLHWGSTVVVAARPGSPLPADAVAAAARYRKGGGTVVDALPRIADFDLVVDALFGIGLTRPLGPPWSDWITAVNESRVPVLALDVPSGLDADTGAIHGSAIVATRTLTFIAGKPGLFTLQGCDCAGQVQVADLDLRIETAALAGTDPVSRGLLLSRSDFAPALKPRPRNTHKGSFGSLGLVGGAAGMTGAAILAGRAALHLGAGRVFVGLAGPSPGYDALQPELMLRDAEAALAANPDVIVLGPGLGAGDAARALVERGLASEVPVLLDADALNLVAGHSSLASRVSRREAPTLMTPHPLEAARLLGLGIEAVQRDRIAAALNLARLYRASVVLKGVGSVVADGTDWWINPSGNPGMATGGMGDVLSGIAGALLAQGLPPTSALLCAVHLHGAAADRLVEDGIGPAGLTAGETIPVARALYNRWCAGRD